MTRRLWFALFAGHLAWTAHLLVSYLLASLPCSASGSVSPLPIHMATVTALAVTVAGIAAGRAVAGDPEASARPFVGRFTITLSVIFLFAIVLAGGTALFVSACA